MTTSEKYVQMNHAFILLRDSIFAEDVTGEKEEDPKKAQEVIAALSLLNNYLDYYKVNNGCKTKVKKEECSKDSDGKKAGGNVLSFPL